MTHYSVKVIQLGFSKDRSGNTHRYVEHMTLEENPPSRTILSEKQSLEELDSGQPTNKAD